MDQAIDTSAFEDLRDVGGALCLDLSNTVDWRGTPSEVDRLRSYADFLAWGISCGFLQPHEADDILRAAAGSPRKTLSALRRVRSLREAIYRIGSSLAAGEGDVPSDALDEANDLMPRLLSHTALAGVGSRSLGYRLGPNDLLSPLTPIVWSLIDLLRGPEAERVCECANASCHWLFVDRSRNRSRRWCAMWNCGNREKGRRFYHEHKGQKTGQEQS